MAKRQKKRQNEVQKHTIIMKRKNNCKGKRETVSHLPCIQKFWP